MLFQVVTTLIGGCLLAVHCRDATKSLKSIPTISGSLVNLGKMDISFHFNSKDTPFKMDNVAPPPRSFFFSKSEPVMDEPCPCSGLGGIKDNFVNHPTDILNKILSNNNLFSFNREPVTSTLCCESHEQVQEDIVTFEFGPKTGMPANPYPNLPRLPFIFQDYLSKRPLMPPPLAMPGKGKAIDIFLFPKKDAPFMMPMKKFAKKDSIQIVGDRELRNDFKSMKFRPTFPIVTNFQSSVKKDLTAQEKNETKAVENDYQNQTEKEDVEVVASTSSNPNALK